MFAYIDETGHSGRNIFDNNEFFRLGSLLTISDISGAVEPIIRSFLDLKDVDRLHANQWPERDLVDLAHQLIDTLTVSSSWTFNLFSVHKPYIAPTKFVDLIFDAGENEAVPGYWYWDEMNRHVLCLVTDAAMSRDLAEAFWRAFLRDDVDGIIRVATEIEASVMASSEPGGIKKIFQSAVRWARKNREKFTLIVTKQRKGYQFHSPNIIAVNQAFQAIHQFCKKYNSYPEVLVHDRQDEFRSVIQKCYDDFGHMLIEDRDDGGVPLAEIAPYARGQLTIMQSSKNFGLQAVDLLLWICQREESTEEIKELKGRMDENLDRYFISREMSQAIVSIHLLKHVST